MVREQGHLLFLANIVISTNELNRTHHLETLRMKATERTPDVPYCASPKEYRFALRMLAALPILALAVAVSAQAQDAFITRWVTTSSDLVIQLGTFGGDDEADYDFHVDWDDGSSEDVSGDDPDPRHTYTDPGTYRVAVTGSFPHLYMAPASSFVKGRLKSVDQWGSIQWTSMNGAFSGVKDLVINATDAPDLSDVTSLYKMFEGAENFNSDIGHWDVSNVTDLGRMFSGAWNFNQDIGSWNVSNVISLINTFNDALDFNQDIGSWDVSNVTVMVNAFKGAVLFDQDIGDWDVSSVINMRGMFDAAEIFNQDLSGWEVSSVQAMASMFKGATSFNQNIGSWDVSSVERFDEMFEEASAFNQPIGGWTVSSATSMESMFRAARAFNQEIGNWDVSSVRDMRHMFNGQPAGWFSSGGVHAFNRDIRNWDVSNVGNLLNMFRSGFFNQDISGWDVSQAAGMAGMFKDAAFFNQDIGGWDVSKVRNFNSMFEGALVFNQNLNRWNVSEAADAELMFASATSFNSPLNSWDVSGIRDMGAMFYKASSFDQDLGDWDVSGVKDFIYPNGLGFLDFTNLSTANYDSLLIGWSKLTLQPGEKLQAGSNRYTSAAAEARQHIIDTYGWEIIDGGIVSGVATEDDPVLPAVFELEQNFPNPFNPHTTFYFTLPREALVRLEIFSLLGQHLGTVLSGNHPAGYHSVRFDASELSSGIYLYRLRAGNKVQTKRMVLLK